MIMNVLATPTISMCAVHTDGTWLLTKKNTLTVKQKIDIIQLAKELLFQLLLHSMELKSLL